MLERTTLLADQPRLGARDVQAALGDLAPLEVVAAPLSYKQACAEFERKLLADTLVRCAGNVPEAARQLGLGRSTLYKKLVALGLSSQ
ncbi:DNA-binding transcriptional regulator DhaR [compost metagenome]